MTSGKPKDPRPGASLSASSELETRDRAAAILILVFGQQAENIARLTWDDVRVTDELVTVQLGTLQIALPDPLAQPWRELAANPGHELTAAHPKTKWVFRGASPGCHINPGHLTTRLSKLFSTRAARLGTLHELTKLAPVAIIAETLGYSPTTIERHATPQTRQSLTLNMSLQQELSDKAPKNPITLGHVGELFPIHVGDVQVVIDSPKFTSNAPERFMRQVAQVNNQHRIVRS
ncbi:hypothetical protein AB4Y75_07050 [Arthrobacter sp. RAF14]